VVTVSGQNSAAYDFDYNPPVIDYINPIGGSSGVGLVVTLVYVHAPRLRSPHSAYT